MSAAVILASCGGTTGSPEEEVTKSVRTYTAGLADGDGKLACDRMTANARRELAAYAEARKIAVSADCPTNVRRFTKRLSGVVARQIRDADVSEIAIEGDVATVHMEDGGPNEVVLRNENGQWRVEWAFARGWRLLGSPSFGMPQS